VLRATVSASVRRRMRLPYSVRHCAVVEQCCSGDLTYLMLQINVICLLLALIGSAVIVKHPDWFGGMPASVAQAIAER
jgi:hypothetical protein